MSFIAELKRRNVIRMAGLYLVGAWLMVQVAGTLLPVFEAPSWVMKTLVGLLAVGFVPALVLSWVFELTPQGIKRDAEVPREESIAPQTARRLDRMIMVVLILALVYFAVDKFVLAPQREAQRGASPAAATAAQKPVVAAAAGSGTPLAPTAPAIAEKSIAVLPFDNLSDDKANAYFAEGMQDEILTRLAGIADLKVISRTSTKRYESHPDNLKTVAAELGAAHILEGSVQKAGDSVRVNVQLIDACSDAHLWAQTFDRELKNVFVVESEVAQQIADVLKARLSPQETKALAKAPTESSTAYDHFLRAEFHLHRAWATFEDADYSAADGEFAQALALDPKFATAYARRAFNKLGRHWSNAHLSGEELAAVKSWIDRALALDADLPAAHTARGFYYYWGSRNYDAAMAEFARTLQLAPNNSDALQGMAFIQRRLGQWDEALASLRRCIAISPRDSILFSEYGTTFVLLRRYDEAETNLTGTLELDSADTNAKDFLLRARLFGRGDVAGARSAYGTQPPWRIPYHNLLAGDLFNLVNARVYPYLFERKFETALHEWDSAPKDSEVERQTQRVARVAIHIVAGETSAQQDECKQLLPLLRAQAQADSDSVSVLQQTSWIELCLGHNAEAIAAARRATEVLPLSKDQYFGVFQAEGLAEIEARAGARDDALNQLDQLLGMAAGESVTVERLKRDPLWDPLRADPRFDALIQRYDSAKPAPSH